MLTVFDYVIDIFIPIGSQFGNARKIQHRVYSQWCSEVPLAPAALQSRVPARFQNEFRSLDDPHGSLPWSQNDYALLASQAAGWAEVKLWGQPALPARFQLWTGLQAGDAVSHMWVPKS